MIAEIGLVDREITAKNFFLLPINPSYAVSQIDPFGTLKADDRRSRFHCQIGNYNEKICNIELWKKDFYELSQDCIIPIHSILGRFIAGTMKIGKKIPKNIYQLFPLIKKFIYKLY